MKINKVNNSTSFKKAYVSRGAEKLLKKADKAVKISDAIFMDINIPEGHKKPLWSVLSEQVMKRQNSNICDIIIDLADKSKKLISVILTDCQGFKYNEWVVNPMPVTGRYNEVFRPKDFLTMEAYKHSLDEKKYGISNFFNVINSAEIMADDLMKDFLSSQAEEKTSVKLLPKMPKQKSPKSERAIMKKLEKKALEKASIPHVQRPFEGLRSLLDSLIEHAKETKEIKPRTSGKTKLPRKIKKRQKRIS